MIIGIDGSRAFLKERTGIEEYSYQVIKNLVNKLNGYEVILYIRKNQRIDFLLPKNWKVKIISWPYFWTQIGLSLELLFHPVDALFIPAHIVPIIYPKNTMVVIHGLEYEFVPEAYPLWERIYMRFAIKKSCRRAQKIIAVSENTKNDLIKLYKVPNEKIAVIYEGISCHSERNERENRANEVEESNKNEIRSLDYARAHKYLLFVGRLEERKNIIGIIQAFEILKEKYKIPHQLVLAGKPGFNYEKIQSYLSDSPYKSEIILPGFVSEEEKGELLKNAEIFLFPTFYEGFGLPILEAQNAGVPVAASTEASIPEVAGEGALLVDPKNPAAIAEATIKIIQDEKLKKDLIRKGLENVKRFSWKKCAKEIADILK